MIKRILLVLVLCLVLGAGALAWLGLQESPRSARAPAPVPDAALIDQGRYLAQVGNCMGCHTAPDQPAYAGGRALQTPFGTFYGPNLTADDRTGIGNWSADDFWRALHNGKRPDGGLLYPAFPYPTYGKMSRADSDALYAYLRSLPPVQQENVVHALDFPYNQRWLLAAWRALYFRPGELEVRTEDASQSAAWVRGRYLVEGLAHCTECHTPRNAFGALRADAGLTGALIPGQNWFAPPLTGDPVTGLGAWTEQDVADLVKTGISRQGFSSGPMAEAVHLGFQHVRVADLQAMSAYLKSLPSAGLDAAARKPAPGAGVMDQGRKIYEAQCASCHQANGEGVYPAWPRLAGNVSVTAVESVNSIRMVLDGGFSPSTASHPQPHGMPPFGQQLRNEDVAAVVSYIRNSWGNEAGAVSLVEVRRVRDAR